VHTRLLILAAALVIALAVAFFVLTDDTSAPNEPSGGAPSAQFHFSASSLNESKLKADS
jgi:hypothetical protein